MNLAWRGMGNPGYKRRMKLWQKIENEFNEPLIDIIIGLRRQENSWRTVAGCLNISMSTLLEWRKALGLYINKNEKIFDESSLPELSPLDKKAIELGYENKVDAIIDLRYNKKKTIKEAGKVLGCHYQTIAFYSPQEIKGIYNKSNAGNKSHIEQCMIMNKTRRQKKRNDPARHPFNKDNDILFRRR